jgi:hypothetical protein
MSDRNTSQRRRQVLKTLGAGAAAATGIATASANDRGPIRDPNRDITFESIYADPGVVQPGETFDVVLQAFGSDVDIYGLEIDYCGLTSCTNSEQVVSERGSTNNWFTGLSVDERGVYTLTGTAQERTDNGAAGVNRDGAFVVAEESDPYLPSVSIDGPATAAVGQTVSLSATVSSGLGSVDQLTWSGDLGGSAFEMGESISVSFDEPGEQTIEVNATGAVPKHAGPLGRLPIDRDLRVSQTESFTITVR